MYSFTHNGTEYTSEALYSRRNVEYFEAGTKSLIAMTIAGTVTLMAMSWTLMEVASYYRRIGLGTTAFKKRTAGGNRIWVLGCITSVVCILITD
jgi:hypothetical protein